MDQAAKIKKEQIETPALVIDLDILERNISIMAEKTGLSGYRRGNEGLHR